MSFYHGVININVIMDKKDLNSSKSTPAGWNDPPMLDHGVKSVPTTKSRIGNKRVAFPLSNNAQQKGHQPNLTNIPTVSNKIQSQSQTGGSASASGTATTDKNFLLIKAVDNFDKILIENCSDPRLSKDIINKIDVMKGMWNQGNLTNEIQHSIYELSEFLTQKNYEEANKLHLQLVMEHATLCSPWIVGIKHLIHMIR